MERMKAEAGKRSASIVFGIVMALLLIFSLGVVGRSGSTAGRTRAQAQSAALTASTSLESYESDSVARSLASAEGSESDSTTPAASPDHPELQLQLD
jgi:hypothetical protein